MIVTHTVNAEGLCRIYLGGKGSLECWLEPTTDGGWTFHVEEAVAGLARSTDEKRSWAVRILMDLAYELDVAPDDLATVPFEAIAALHAPDPFAGRRLPTGRRKLPENAFLASPPGITRPRADFSRGDFERHYRPR